MTTSAFFRKVSLVAVASSVAFSASGVMTAGDVLAQDLLPQERPVVRYFESPRYRDSESSPLRIAAYILHPIGWVLREAIFRPFSSFAASSETTRDVLGYREPFDYREPMCFSNPEGVPDCHVLPPMNALIKAPGVSTDKAASQVDASDRQVYFPSIAFEYDRATLTSLGKGRVRQVAQLLAAVPSVKVVVEGHTDNRGSDSYNTKLGERRAEVVVKELVDLGIDPARMSKVSYGKSKPLFTEDTDWARAVNRRVQFTVAGEAPAAAGTLPPAAS